MSEFPKDPLDQIPSRVKYYLLEWKDKNMNEFQEKFGEVRLRDLSLQDLHDLFIICTTSDSILIQKTTEQ